MLRLFVACEFDEPSVIEGLTRFQEKVLGGFSGIKLVEPNNMHFTLAFLGDQQEEGLSLITRALGKIRFQAAQIGLRGTGAFPSLRNPRVIFVSAANGADWLSGLASQVRENLSKEGVWYDRTPFSPHITLARVKRTEPGLYRELTPHMDDDFGSISLDTVRLKKSSLTPAGPVYESLFELHAHE